jgi:hypothetical protein
MMFNRLSKISAKSFTTAFAVSAVASLAGAPVALAQSYPPPPGYSQPLQPAPYGAGATIRTIAGYRISTGSTVTTGARRCRLRAISSSRITSSSPLSSRATSSRVSTRAAR